MFDMIIEAGPAEHAASLLLLLFSSNIIVIYVYTYIHLYIHLYIHTCIHTCSAIYDDYNYYYISLLRLLSYIIVILLYSSS